jgi:hypothetical protein
MSPRTRISHDDPHIAWVKVSCASPFST